MAPALKNSGGGGQILDRTYPDITAVLSPGRREEATAAQQADIAMAIKVQVPVDVSEAELLALR